MVTTKVKETAKIPKACRWCAIHVSSPQRRLQVFAFGMQYRRRRDYCGLPAPHVARAYAVNKPSRGARSVRSACHVNSRLFCQFDADASKIPFGPLVFSSLCLALALLTSIKTYPTTGT